MATDLPKNNSCNSFLPTTWATPVVDMELLQVLCAQASAGSSSPAPGNKKNTGESSQSEIKCGVLSLFCNFSAYWYFCFQFHNLCFGHAQTIHVWFTLVGGHLHLSYHPSWAIKSYCSGMDPWVTGFNILCITTILSIWDHWSLFSNNKPDDTWIYESKKTSYGFIVGCVRRIWIIQWSHWWCAYSTFPFKLKNHRGGTQILKRQATKPALGPGRGVCANSQIMSNQA